MCNVLLYQPGYINHVLRSVVAPVVLHDNKIVVCLTKLDMVCLDTLQK